MSRDPSRDDARTRRGLVLNVQRMSTEDGPGIRSTVFLKGCSLACDWCHNPESISPHREVVWHGVHCIGCKTCVGVCPYDAASMSDDGFHVDRARCSACGVCAENCPTTAREVLGRRWDAEALADEVARDRAFFERSGGGVTVSGGEPGVQAEFAEALLRACGARGLHTVLDTCGQCSAERLLSMARQADLVLYDVKLLDDEAHRRHTGHGNERILANLRALGEQMRAGGRPGALWVRTPLIPGATATQDNVGGIGAALAELVGDVMGRWDLCAFNNLCRDKYERLGRRWSYADTPLLTRRQMAILGEAARDSGVEQSAIHVTGLARLERAP